MSFRIMRLFLRVYASLLHESVDGFYRVFQIHERVTLQNFSAVPPEVIGCDPEWRNVPKSGVTQSFYDNAILFRPMKRDHQNMHPICLNPCLHNFSEQTQNYILDMQRGRLIRDWVDAFARKKNSKHLLAMNPVYGNNSTYWLSCASPRNLPVLLRSLPNSSYISVLYGSQYSYPDTRLPVVDISSLSVSMQVKQSADCVNVIVSSSPTSANYMMIFKEYSLPCCSQYRYNLE